MSQSAMPHRRIVVAAALVLLAWIAAPRTSELLLLPAPSAPASTPTIESKTDLLVTSDRPVVSVHGKRSEGQRLPSAMTAVDAGMAALLAVAREVRRPGPLIPDEPLAFGIAPRGPPLSMPA